MSLHCFFLYIILEFTNAGNYDDARKTAKNIGLICFSMDTWTHGDKEQFFNLKPEGKGESSRYVCILEFTTAE